MRDREAMGVNLKGRRHGDDAGQGRVGRLLARQLLPLTVVVALLIGVGFPAGYYAAEVRASKRAASAFAEDLAGHIGDLLARPENAGVPAARQIGVGPLIEASARHRHIEAIRVLDATGDVISGWQYGSWPSQLPRRGLAPVGSAPLRLDGHGLGTVEVFGGPGPLLAWTAMFLLFGGSGLALAVLMYRWPLRVVEGVEQRIEGLIDSRSNAALGRHATAQRSLVAAARALAGTLDPAAVGQRIADTARELVDAPASVLYDRDPDTLNLRVRALSGPEEREAGWPESLAPGSGVMGLAVAEGRAVATQDCLVDPRLRIGAETRARLQSSPYRAVLAVPLVARDTLIGALALCCTTGRIFDHEAIALVQALADQAALAVENARLYGEARQGLIRSEALLEASRAVGSTLDLTETMRRLARELGRASGADMVGAYLADADGLYLRPMAGYHVPKHMMEDFLARPIPLKGHPFMEEAFASARPMSTSDPAGDARVDPSLLDWLRVRSVLFVPICVEQTPIGGFFIVWWERRHLFSEETRRLAEGIARHGALAIANARLFEKTQRALRESEVLLSVAKSVSSTLDPVEIMRRICRQAALLVGAESAIFFTVDLLSGYSQPAAGYRIPKTLMATVRPLSAAELPSTLLEAIDKREAVFVRDVSTDPRTQGLTASELPIRSLLALPVHAKDEGFGTLVLFWWNAASDLTPGAIDLLAALAGQGALALENARLFSETRAQARSLAAKNAELDSFVFSVSHDLKAPLVTIQGMSELAVKDCGPRLDAEGRHLLERIRFNAEDMGRLVEDILALSRIGREARAAEQVDLGKLTDDLLLELAEPIRARGITVGRGDLGTVWAVPTHMEQVFRNLLSNAVKYTGTGASPVIEIGVADRGDAVEFWVRDSGIGIDPAHHAMVFEVFRRLKQVEVEGSGVGLAIVKKIVDGAGGRIWVESALGGGATFRFTWPKGPEDGRQAGD